MAASNVWQQVLALDARYNAHRTPNHPNFRTLYIRRRSQLLRANSKDSKRDPVVRKQYIKIRSQVLAQRYGVCPSDGYCYYGTTGGENGSTAESSLRKRSPIVPTADAGASSAQIITGGVIYSWDLSTNQPADWDLPAFSDNLRATTNVVVNQPHLPDGEPIAIVGNTSLSENYSFAGVHHIFDQHKLAISRIKWANDEYSRLAVASMDGLLSISTVAQEPNKSAISVLLKGHSKGITDFEWSISNDLIVTCSLDCTVRVWDPTSGECIRIVEDSCPVLSCSFEPLNNNLVMTGNSKGQIQVLNISTGKYIKTGANKVPGAAVSMCSDSSGKFVWIGDDKGNIVSFLIDANSGKVIKGQRTLVCSGATISSVSSKAWVSRETRDPLLLVNTTHNSLFLYKICGSNGSLQFRKRFHLEQNKHRIRGCFCPLMSFREGACICTFVYKNRPIPVSGSEDGNVYLLNIEKDSQVSESCAKDQTAIVNKLQGHAAPVIDVNFNHDESFLSSGDATGTVIVWKRERRKAQECSG